MLRAVTEQGVVPHMYLSGEMDLDCADSLRTAVTEAVRGAEMVVIDFGKVDFIDSSGTGIFVRLCLDLKSQGIAVHAANLSAAVADVFAMLRVRDLVGDEAFTD